MNTLDKKYTDLLQDILDNGTKKQTRNGEVLSVFGRQIRHSMSEGFPLLTTKKMYFKGIVTELLWFLRGDTSIKFLVDNGCHIWDGDAYKNYCSNSRDIDLPENLYNKLIDDLNEKSMFPIDNPSKKLTQEEFINKIKTDDEFAKKWGDLGSIYGKQWRSWNKWENAFGKGYNQDIDQIANLINDLKTNPDSRRLLVNSWNVGELSEMVLPPCHYGFQVYTRELSLDERLRLVNYDKEKFNSIDEWITWYNNKPNEFYYMGINYTKDTALTDLGVPTRAISLMWNQRSVDTPLGLPFNIASYGLLLEIIAKMVNMVPDELIGNLGDCHIYSNQIDGVKEQIGRELSHKERSDLKNSPPYNYGKPANGRLIDERLLDSNNVPKRTREPYPLPTLNINTEWWSTESGECGVGPIDAMAVVRGFFDDNFCKCLLEEDIQLANYKSHPAIRMPLSN